MAKPVAMLFSSFVADSDMPEIPSSNDSKAVWKHRFLNELCRLSMQG